MIRFIKKWWFIEKLRKEISRHTNFQSIEDLSGGREVLLSFHFFISNDPEKQHKEYPGLAYRSLRRFSYILFWRKKIKPDKLKKRIQNYNDISKICVKEGYIEMVDTIKGKMPSVATPEADKISGIWGLLQGILERYNSVWTLVFIPVITFLAGVFIKYLIEFFRNL